MQDAPGGSPCLAIFAWVVLMAMPAVAEQTALAHSTSSAQAVVSSDTANPYAGIELVPRPFKEVVSSIKDADSEVRYQAAMELGHYWPESKALLKSLLKDPDGGVRLIASGGLLVNGDRSGEKVIDEVMRMGDHDVLLPVAHAICTQKPKLALDTLERMLLSKKKAYVQRLSAAFLLDDFAAGVEDRRRVESTLTAFFSVKTIEEAREEMRKQMKKHNMH